MRGYFCLVLHAHLPFVRHPEHERFLEENWLFEAVAETYLPLLELLENWHRQGLPARLTLTLTPTLCAMLRDPLLQTRCRRHLDDLIDLAEKEIHRTLWEKPFHTLALLYHERFSQLREAYDRLAGDLVGAFRRCQERGQIEIIACAATHAVLPLLLNHPPSLRAQVLVGRDEYVECFGCEPRGIWLPECAYGPGIETVLREAGFRWFILESHGLLHAQPRPRYATFAPVFTRAGVAAFGRDLDSAKQVWSRHEGYPGDPRYRDFYRDIGWDLDLEYLRPHLPAADQRGFTGLKYHRIGGHGTTREAYDRPAALRAAEEHAGHFLKARQTQAQRLLEIFDRPPVVVAPYDAELFGHWWHEGPVFLDQFVRKACSEQELINLVTPEDYLRLHPTNQVSMPAASSWGEEGYWRVWLNEKNEWIYRRLQPAQRRMSELAERYSSPGPLLERALNQAARELLLAQASDWPFILRTGTSPGYARQRVTEHLDRFDRLYHQMISGAIDPSYLATIESRDNPFPSLSFKYWKGR